MITLKTIGGKHIATLKGVPFTFDKPKDAWKFASVINSLKEVIR